MKFLWLAYRPIPAMQKFSIFFLEFPRCGFSRSSSWFLPDSKYIIFCFYSLCTMLRSPNALVRERQRFKTSPVHYVISPEFFGEYTIHFWKAYGISNQKNNVFICPRVPYGRHFTKWLP